MNNKILGIFSSGKLIRAIAVTQLISRHLNVTPGTKQGFMRFTKNPFLKKFMTKWVFLLQSSSVPPKKSRKARCSRGKWKPEKMRLLLSTFSPDRLTSKPT